MIFMTLVENLHANNAEPRRKYRKQPKAELRLLYPVVNEMFDEITQAQNCGYSWNDIGTAVLERMAKDGISVQYIQTYDVADIYRHIRRDRELRGLLGDE